MLQRCSAAVLMQLNIDSWNTDFWNTDTWNADSCNDLMQIITQESGEAYELTQPMSEQQILQTCSGTQEEGSGAAATALSSQQLERTLK